jgi:hypothetical protein
MPAYLPLVGEGLAIREGSLFGGELRDVPGDGVCGRCTRGQIRNSKVPFLSTGVLTKTRLRCRRLSLRDGVTEAVLVSS